MSGSASSLGEAVLYLTGDDTPLQNTTKSAKSKAESVLAGIGTGMKTLGVGVLAAGTTLAAVGTGIYKLTTESAANADEIMQLSKQYGISTDQLQKMKYAAELVDVPLETMLGSMTKLTRSIGDAQNPTSEQAALFKELGVNTIDPLTGQLRSANDVWNDTIDALGKVENPTQRNIIAMGLMGKSADELNPLIAEGTDKLAALGEEAQRSGYVLSSSQLEALGKVDDAVQRMKNSFTGITQQLGAMFAPGVATVVEKVGGYLGKLGGIMSDDTLTGAEKIQKGADLLKEIGDDITAGLPKLVEAGTGILKSLLLGLTASIPTLIPVVIDLVMQLVRFLMDAAPLLLNGAIMLVVTLANGISQALPGLIIMFAALVPQLLLSLIGQLPTIIQAGLGLVLALIQGLLAAIPQLISMVPTLISSLVESLIMATPDLIMAAIQIVLALGFGIIENIPLLLSMLPTLIQQLVDKFKSKEFQTKMAEMGRQLIAGISEGWKSAWENFKTQTFSNFTELITKIKKLLGINSPADATMPIGTFAAEGVGVGWKKNWANVEDSILRSMSNTFNFNPMLRGVAAGNSSESWQFNAPIIIQGGNSLRETIKERKWR